MLSYNPIRDRVEGSSSITFLCENDATLQTREAMNSKVRNILLRVLGVLLVGVLILLL